MTISWLLLDDSTADIAVIDESEDTWLLLAIPVEAPLLIVSSGLTLYRAAVSETQTKKTHVESAALSVVGVTESGISISRGNENELHHATVASWQVKQSQQQDASMSVTTATNAQQKRSRTTAPAMQRAKSRNQTCNVGSGSNATIMRSSETTETLIDAR